MDGHHGALLKKMLSDMERADPLHRPTHYWRLCSKRLLSDLERHGIEGFRSFPSSLYHFVPTYVFGDLAAEKDRFQAVAARVKGVLEDDPKAGLAMDEFLNGRAQAMSDYRVYLASYRDKPPFTLDVSESLVGEPVGQACFDGRRYSRSMLNYLLGLNFAKQQLEALPVGTVLEIGGGFGTLGEILSSDPRNESFYIDVDIPPTALFATYYLRQVLGEDRVADYSETADSPEIHLDKLRRPGGAAVLCPWQLPSLRGRIDLFVNFISFQEMEPPVVESYLEQVRRLEATHVLLRNIREGKQIAHDDEQLGVKEATRSEDYDRFLPGYELVAANVTPFGYRTVDGFHSELRLYRRK